MYLCNDVPLTILTYVSVGLDFIINYLTGDVFNVQNISLKISKQGPAFKKNYACEICKFLKPIAASLFLYLTGWSSFKQILIYKVLNVILRKHIGYWDHLPSKVCDKIIHPFANFKGNTV